MIDIADVKAQVRDLPTPALSDADRIDLLRGLEELKCITEAAQAALSADFAESQVAKAADAGVPAARRTRGIAAQIALARRESPHRGQRHLGLAMILREELPCTWAAFSTGRITEWKATLMARETACLALEQRLEVDQRLAHDADPGVSVNVILPDTVLTGQTESGAYLDGYGPIPADLARDLAAGATWLRRLYADTHTGALVAMESTRRHVPHGMARFLRYRDRICRTPWCERPGPPQ